MTLFITVLLLFLENIRDGFGKRIDCTIAKMGNAATSKRMMCRRFERGESNVIVIMIVSRWKQSER